MKAVIVGEKGQHLVQFVLLLPLLIAFMGLVVDVGNAYVHQRLAQNAVDAAATAGGMVLHEKGATAAESAARYYAAVHGYNNDRVSNFVDLSWPSQCIRVQVTENVRPVFASIVWNGAFPVRATAAACYRTEGVGSTVLILDSHVCTALDISGGATVQVSKGNLHANSDCSTAIDMSGGGRLVTQTPASYVGGYKISGGALISPEPVKSSIIPDPLAALPVPAACGACPSRSTEKFTKGVNDISPTCHMGGIDISGGTVTFAPGVYCIGGSGLKISSQARVSGSGVTLYLDKGNLDLSGDNSLSLTPPTSGDYNGILVFQARNNTSAASLSGQVVFEGLNGIIYLPAAELSISGGATTHINLVANRLKATGGAALDIQGYGGVNWQTVTDSLTE